jgi:hypothetical protein
MAMIYELRIYRCVPGRQPALLSRFENETLRIWEKHGIRQAGWTTLIGKSSQEITYMLAWDSMAEREKRWDAFLADPEWGGGGRQDGTAWPARREHQQPVPGANRRFRRIPPTDGRAAVVDAESARGSKGRRERRWGTPSRTQLAALAPLAWTSRGRSLSGSEPSFFVNVCVSPY